MNGNYRTPRTIPCGTCGVPFNAIRPKMKYCSAPCAAARGRVTRRESLRRTRKRMRAEILNRLGGACAICGIRDKRVLEIDHVQGDGDNNGPGKPPVHPDTKLRRMLAELDSGEVRIQALCANCHKIKTLENGDSVEIAEAVTAKPKCGPGYRRRLRRYRRFEIMRRLGNRCLRCGAADIRALEIDHIAGDGDNAQSSNPAPEDRGVQRGRLLAEMDAGICRVQLLCANCHHLKTRECGENRLIEEDLSYRMAYTRHPLRAVA